jgi:(4S)-4-hydroxy-5-phosphonooxypentane-2,3-dione isomerase
VTPLVLLVEFRVKPKDREKFRLLIVENAAASRQYEPGCRQFDVLVPEDAAVSCFILYEIYDDDAAFRAHLQSDHYLHFDKASAAMIVEKTVRQLRPAQPESAASQWAPA